MTVYSCHSSYSGSGGRRIAIEGWPRQKHEILSEEQTKTKGLQAWQELVESCPSKHKALNSIPSTVKKKKKEASDSCL
jgi:hypothetical protein